MMGAVGPDGDIPVRRSGEVLEELVDWRGKRVLDAGCGGGRLLAWLSERRAQAVGLDVGAAALSRARTLGTWPLVRAAAERLPLKTASFDIVLFFNSLHHVPVAAQDEALSEAARTLAPGGFLLIAEPVAAGEHFELLRPIDDETAIRAAAEAAIGRVERSSFDHIERRHTTQEIVHPSLDDLIRGFIAVDPSRSTAVDHHRVEIEERFERLGRGSAKGRVFRQPMRFDLLRRRSA